MSNSQYQHWQINQDTDNVVWLYIDKANASANTFDASVLDELADILQVIAADKTAKALIIASKKSSGFIAGANIEKFSQFENEQQALAFIEKGQKTFKQLADLIIPTVAMIEGFCLGGGLELALACNYRIAEESAKTRLGLPEVKLGIQPGWGGSVRLTRLVGPMVAMDLILSGRTVDGKQAAKLGIIDAAVPKRHLEKAARYYALTRPEMHKPAILSGFANVHWARYIIAKLLRRKVAQKARADHYPAPYAIINNWEKLGIDDEQAFTAEAHSIVNLLQHDTAHNLIKVFFLQERLKSLGKSTGFTAKHVHVIGAGTMGGDIAAWCALQGYRVTLQDREPKFIAPAIKRAFGLYSKRLKKPRLIQEAMDRLMPDVNGMGIGKADIIIEAIYENLEAKQSLFKALEQQAKPTAILATNTSSIPLDEINVVLQTPGRLVGIHFFNPVAMMPLVEVVQGNQSDPMTVKQALAFVKAIDRYPLPVKSSPGFLVNRILMPYLMESMILLQEGVAAEAIDKAAVDFGMPMGPIELADTVGLDVCLSVADNLAKHYGGEVPQKLRQMVEQKHWGKKTNQGFYHYKNGKAVRQKLGVSATETSQIADRLILRMLNEAVACLREQVIADIELLDAGMIFGTGFAPFRGGPIHYAKQRGVQATILRLEELQKQYGERFKPDEAWQKLTDV
ncbi:MAG: fadJ [Gammaproteobacteria bacterium]|jgi:3-hydroxyacyl-CoA dehydrogenase/enoyl-CoA hydratase/3-hydroxybutyryl-CoA epimerase|nr:fadJ [Gammaproteobacteria bacterium]